MAGKETRSVFISHRHIDHAVADVFRETIETWSDGAINVYQSSHAENASRISADLDEAIADAIADCSIVLLIYTEAPGDLDWCMFECGLAQDPRSRDTRVAVFHTTSAPPSPLDGLISMRLEQESVLQFANGFHRDPQFMPDLAGALVPDISDEDLEERAKGLYQQLCKVAPERARETTVYDRLTLGISYAAANKIRDHAEKGKLKDTYDFASQLLPQSLVIRSSSGQPEEHFNYSDTEGSTTFGDLVERWQSDSEFARNNHWPEGVYEAITRALLNRPEREVAYPFNSLTTDGSNWLMPILARHRTVPFERIIEFDLLFCRIDRETALRMVKKS
ncbi:MAG: toll/interleukin-1 receptor domain-containing protein [Gammaproteobacteria bacterium]|nr:toll/interleukin-1 receptor domain-containing protein [Gammaproteobacteria bacterium]